MGSPSPSPCEAIPFREQLLSAWQYPQPLPQPPKKGGTSLREVNTEAAMGNSGFRGSWVQRQRPSLYTLLGPLDNVRRSQGLTQTLEAD